MRNALPGVIFGKMMYSNAHAHFFIAFAYGSRLFNFMSKLAKTEIYRLKIAGKSFTAQTMKNSAWLGRLAYREKGDRVKIKTEMR